MSLQARIASLVSAIGADIKNHNSRLAIVEKELVVASEVTSVGVYDLTGLDGNIDKSYRIVIEGDLAVGGTDRHISVMPNGVPINTSSNTVGLGTTNTREMNTAGSWSGGDDDGTPNGRGMYFGRSVFSAGGRVIAEGYLSARVGGKRAYMTRMTYATTATAMRRTHGYGWAWIDTATKITSLKFDFGGGTFTGMIKVYRNN